MDVCIPVVIHNVPDSTFLVTKASLTTSTPLQGGYVIVELCLCVSKIFMFIIILRYLSIEVIRCKILKVIVYIEYENSSFAGFTTYLLPLHPFGSLKRAVWLT